MSDTMNNPERRVKRDRKRLRGFGLIHPENAHSALIRQGVQPNSGIVRLIARMISHDRRIHHDHAKIEQEKFVKDYTELYEKKFGPPQATKK
ncbi:MAG: hypothetical protein WC308_02910 [archaeon]|jgi:hypothetical protein